MGITVEVNRFRKAKAEERKKPFRMMGVHATRGDAERVAGIYRDSRTSCRVYEREIKADNCCAVVYVVIVRGGDGAA